MEFLQIKQPRVIPCQILYQGAKRVLDILLCLLILPLNTIHNLHFYLDLMPRLRAAIEAGQLAGFAREFLARQAQDEG